MPEVTSPILPLPQEVAAQIKSSTSITSVTSAVLGLLANSLDAGARKVDITVDFSRGIASVEDDGEGIPPKEFGETGGLGKAYRELRLSKAWRLWLTAFRYIEAQYIEHYPWGAWNFLDLGCRTINSDNHVPPSKSHTSCHPDSASLETGCETCSSAFIPAYSQS